MRGPNAVAPWRRLLGLVVLLVVGAVIIPAPPVADATSIVPFAPRFSANDNGSIAIFGNNLLTCPQSADCTGARAGTNNKNNNGFVMVPVDVDDDASTFSSSRATVTLPDDGEVAWAGLYWGARLGAGAGGGRPAVGNGRQMKLNLPGPGGYQTITANQLFGPTATSDRAYQAFAVVTDLVRQAGPGTYTGADVPAATGEDRYAGWSLVVVYRSPSMPLRNLTVFDGLADVGQNDPQAITISGFRTPVDGQVNARIGLVAYEGDNGSSGDRAILRDGSNPGGTLLATRLSQGTNFFNGANDDNGTLVTARTPADRNMLGFDIKNFDGPGILGNSQTSATIDLASTSERYFPGVVTTAIDVFAPDFSPSTKSVENLTGPTPARVGDRLRYTVTFVNGGQDPAVNTSILDPIPPGTTYVPGSLVVPAGTTGTFDPAAGVRVQPGAFPVGRSVTFSFDVDVGDEAAGTDVSNAATITYDGATVPELRRLTFATRAASIAVVPSADLVITKVNNPDSVVAGNVLTSIIVVRNDGPSPATAVVVTDELPPGVTGVTATATRGSCTTAVSCAIGTVPSGATVTVTVTARVPPGSTAASLTDVARVNADTADPNPVDNTAGAGTEVVRNADLAVTKSVTPATAAPGEEVTYTLTATNDGPSTATSVALTDAVVDPGVVLTGATAPGATCSFDATGARCTRASLAPGASVEMTVTGLVVPSATPGVSLSNAAVVQSGTPDDDPSDNGATSAVTVGPVNAGLTVTKSASAPDPLLAGLGQVRYTVEVTSTGPSDADPVTLTDQLPAGFTAVSATSSRGTCTITDADRRIECDLGTLTAPFGTTPGARSQITIVAQVPPGVEPGTYANTATADAPGTAPVESDPASVTVEGRADLSVVKSFPEGSPDAIITPGTTETYRIRVANQGPSTAADVSVADALPPGLTASAFRVQSVTPTGPTPACDAGAATCDLGDLPPGTVVELEIDVDVPDDFQVPAQGVINTASVSSDTPDPNQADNESSFTAGGPPSADVSVRKIPPTEQPVAGGNASYVLEIVNFGPSAAPALVITDALPPGTSFVRYFDPTGDPVPPGLCEGDGADPETVTCDFGQFTDPIGGFPAFVGTRIGIEIAIDATTPNGTLLENTATISADLPDPNEGNNTSTAVVSVRTEVNLRLEKLVVEMDAGGNPILPPVEEDADPLGVPPGHAVTFGLLVTNDGPSAATDVQVIDDVPWQGGNFPTGTCDFLTGDVVCSKTDGPLGPGEQFFTQLITLPAPDTPQGVYTNTARVTTSSTETNLDDNSDSRTVEIVDPVADLIIDKQALTSPLVAGGTFSYRIAVRAGLISLDPPTLRLSSNAEDVVVTDALPAGLVPTDITSSQGDCTLAGQQVRCELGTVRAGVTLEPVQPALITVTGTVASNLTGAEVTNTAVATTSTDLLGEGTEVSDSTTTPLERRADLSLTKTADAETVAAGGSTAFSVTVTNTGPSDATGVELTDLLPAPYVFDPQDSDPRCALDGGEVTCDLATVAPGAAAVIVIAATVPADAPPGTIENTASVESDVDDPDDSNNTAAADVEVIQQADLSVTKTPAADGVLLGGTLAYTLVVTNGGPSDAAAAVLTESIPEGTSVQTPLPDGCTGTGPVTCALDDLPAGGTASLEILLAVPETTQVGPLTNIASVSSSTDDPEERNNETAATVEAIAQADVVLDKRLVTENPVAGEPVVFEFVLTNRGPTIAPRPSLSDPLPPGTGFVSFTVPGGECQLDETADEDVPTASCTLAPLRVGASVTARLVLDTDPTLTTITNTGYAGSGGLDDVPADNEDTVVAQLREAPPTGSPSPGSPSPSPGSPSQGSPAPASSTTAPTSEPQSSGDPLPTEEPDPPGEHRLPSTGGTPLLVLVLGSVLVLGGAGLWASSARRRTRPSHRG